MRRIGLNAALAFALWGSGCADSGIDREDELGTTQEGRYELVELEPGAASIDTAADQSSDPANIAVFFDPEGPYTVQIGVYRDAERAAKLVAELKEQGYPAYGANSPEGMRVRIGYFTEWDDAERFGRIFAADRDVEYWVDRRADE